MKDELLMIMIFILQGAFFKMATQCKCLRLHSFRKIYKKICFLNQRSDFVTFNNSKVHLFGIYFLSSSGLRNCLLFLSLSLSLSFSLSLSLSWETKNLHYRFSFQIKQVIFQNLIYFISGSFFYVDISKKCIV